jgi:type II secretory pathway component PulC
VDEEEPRPDADCDALDASGDFRDLFRYERGDEVRTYKLRMLTTGAELWRTTEKGGDIIVSVKEDDFEDVDDAVHTLQELMQRLRAGGWREVRAR